MNTKNISIQRDDFFLDNQKYKTMKKILLLLLIVSLTTSCNQPKKKQQKKQSKTETKNYKKIGMQYALSTKKVLGQNLKGKMESEGVIKALEFCNINALSLTDSMSVLHNATIRRVTDKARNVNNQATAEEINYINEFKKMIANNQKVTPIINVKEDNVNFYAPITTNGLCLQCHGTKGKELNSKTFTAIRELYPDDLAVNYSVNEVRGIWSITFNKQSKD